jgi:hypothetical protein
MFGENVTKMYFNLENVYDETLAFMRRRVVCSITKILELTDFKITPTTWYPLTYRDE